MADWQEVVRERARMVREDTAHDVADMDGKAFTGANVGATFGIVFAQVGALAKCIEELIDHLGGAT